MLININNTIKFWEIKFSTTLNDSSANPKKWKKFNNLFEVVTWYRAALYQAKPKINPDYNPNPNPNLSLPLTLILTYPKPNPRPLP